MNTTEYMAQVCQQARNAAKELIGTDTAKKNNALHLIADELLVNSKIILQENKKDMDAGRANGLEPALIDRLELSEQSIIQMAEGCRQVASLADPIGEITDMSYRPSGIQVGKMRVALGVIGIIYESRPNVTVDAAILCIQVR